MSSDPTINVLLSTFPGTGLPRTLSIPVPSTTPITTLSSVISSYLPRSIHGLLLTTISHRLVDPSSPLPLSSLLPSISPTTAPQQNDAAPLTLTITSPLLPLHLSHPLPGGKGGFGSQLRAAGGRMSSRKRNANSSLDPHGSNRNLDGRRLRTVTEAKALAEYLSIKPEMERREKEERRRRWDAVVAEAERREEEIREGRKGKGGRVDGKWVEGKEEVEERTKEAVVRAMREGVGVGVGVRVRVGVGVRVRVGVGVGGRESDESPEGSEGSEDSEGVEGVGRSGGKGVRDGEAAARTFFGWDEEVEDVSDSEEEVEAQVVVGKGKEKAL